MSDFKKQFFMKKEDLQSGLSLVELMIVVSIISILSAAATQQYNLYTLKTRCELSRLPGDLDGNYDLGGLEVTNFIQNYHTNAGSTTTVGPKLFLDDEIKRREFAWDDINGDGRLSFLDLGPFNSALNAGSAKCFENGFKSKFNRSMPSVDPRNVPFFGSVQ